MECLADLPNVWLSRFPVSLAELRHRSWINCRKEGNISINDVNLRNELLHWFIEHGRSYSWRQSASPFVVLIAEILLKKTAANTVERFIPGFLARYPDPFSIARSTVAELTDFLIPIGLSTQRAVQIKNLAETLIRDHKGQVPSELAQLLALPGVGPYIGSAMRCYAFNGIEAPVDTNVARILVRLHGISPSRYEARRSPEVWELASELVGQNIETVRELNWALIDLGAQVCTARKPICRRCPLASGCHYAKSGELRMN